LWTGVQIPLPPPYKRRIMILTNKEETVLEVRCECGTETIRIEKLESEGYPTDYILTIGVDMWYNEQEGIFYSLKKKFKMIWFLLTKGTYIFTEIMMNEESFKLFQEKISQYK